MITCREFIEFLDDFLSESLPEEQRRQFEKHLTVCPDCAAYMDSYEKTVELMRTLADCEEPPVDIPEELVRAIARVIKS